MTTQQTPQKRRKEGEDPADNGRLIGVDLRQAVRPLAVAEKAGVVVVDLARPG